ncbi:MAG TPA: sigma-70 family RNA polymerase sigma factor [Streptosporangiaceae bacterium]|jgi:RNA polymerase sigma-70 factor (sigma-E family)
MTLGDEASAISAGHGGQLGAAPDVLDVSTLFREHQAGLVRLAVLLVRDRPTAEDVVQDAFAAVHARSDRLGPDDDLLAYVRACVVNGCRRVLRRRAVERRLGGARDQPASWPGRSAEQEVIWSEDRRRVLAALAALPQRRQEVLVLRYYLGLSEAEIAAVLKIRPGTVKSTAARGLAALATAMGEEA